MEILLALRAIVAGAFFLLPGFVWSYAFFRKVDELSLLERMATSFGLSIAMSVLSLLVANRLFGMPVNLLSVAATLGLLTAAGLVFVFFWMRSGSPVPAVSSPKGADTPEYLVLAAVLIFAFFMAYIPHLNYPYPLHIDEWEHFALSQSLLEAGTTDYLDPLLGEKRVSGHPEGGFHLFLAQLRLLSGLSWITIFRFVPAFVFMVTVMGAYLFGRRSNFGLEAAFFAAFIPTTVRMLGPSFLVPVTLSLSFLPIILFLLHYYYESKPSTVVLLLLLLAFMFINHPPSAAVVSVAPAVYAGMQWLEHRREPRHRLKLALVIAGIGLAFLVLYLRFPFLIMAEVKRLAESKLPPYGFILDALLKYGYVSLAIFLAGIGFLTYRWQRVERNLLVLTAVYIGIIGLFNSTGYGVTIIADRAWLFFLLTASIVAGYGAHQVLTSALDYRSRASSDVRKWASTGVAAATVLVLVLSGVVAVQQRTNEPYYHLVTKGSYEDMVWIKQNVSSDYRRAVVDTPLGLAFPPVAGRPVYAGESVQVYIPSRIREVNAFLSAGASNTTWMKARGIDMVYTRRTVNNPDLKKVREWIYLLPK